MEFEPQVHARIYDGIDELIKSLNQLLGVSKTVNSMLLKHNFASRSFEQNTDYAHKLISISEEAIRAKNQVIGDTLRFYNENSGLRVWDRLISRFNNSIMMAHGQNATLLTCEVFREEGGLDSYFDAVARENILAVKKLYKSIFQLQLETTSECRRTQRWSRIFAPNITEKQKKSYEMLIYQEGMRIMNELALVSESSLDMVDKLESMNVEFDEGLDKNLTNIFKNMMVRNSKIKDSIETYARDYHDHLMRLHDISSSEASDVYIEAPEVTKMEERISRTSNASKNVFLRKSQLADLEFFITEQQSVGEAAPQRKLTRMRTDLNSPLVPPDFSFIDSIKSLRRYTEINLAPLGQNKISGTFSKRQSRNFQKTAAQSAKENEAILVALTSPFITKNQKATVRKHMVESKRVSVAPFSEMLNHDQGILPRNFSRKTLHPTPTRGVSKIYTSFSNPIEWISIKAQTGEQRRRLGLVLRKTPLRIRKRNLSKTFETFFTERGAAHIRDINISGSITIKEGENLHLHCGQISNTYRYGDFVRKTESNENQEAVSA